MTAKSLQESIYYTVTFTLAFSYLAGGPFVFLLALDIATWYGNCADSLVPLMLCSYSLCKTEYAGLNYPMMSTI